MDIEIPNRVVVNIRSTSSVAQNPMDVRSIHGELASQSAQQGVSVSASSAERLTHSVDELNDLVQSVQRDLHFSIDEVSGETVIQVLDTKTDEVIRQIPSKEVLALTHNIESLKGILFSAEV